MNTQYHDQYHDNVGIYGTENTPLSLRVIVQLLDRSSKLTLL